MYCKVRLSEHRKATRQGKEEGLTLAEHACKEGHEPSSSYYCKYASIF